MQSYKDVLSFVYSDQGTYFFKRLYQEVEQMQRSGQSLAGGHLIEELDMTLSEALNLAVSATFAIQDEFLGKDHHKDFDAWKGKHAEEDMDYQTWIHKSLIYQLDELKLTDINTVLNSPGTGSGEGTAGEKEGRTRKKRRFFGKH